MFVIFIVVTLGITFWASKRSTGSSAYFAAGRSIKAWQNGVAVAGDYMSAASFLGIAGLIAFFGYDGFMYSVGWLVAYLTVLLVVAEPLRNAGKYTMADVLAYRLKARPVRAMASISTLTVSTFYMIAQMVGAGALVKLLLAGHVTYNQAVIGVGILMIVYVVFGGMLATTWVQIVKAVLMLAAAALILVLALSLIGFNPLALFAEAETRYGPQFLLPGNYLKNPFDHISLGLGYVLGLAGLPHVMTRFYTVPDATTARRSVVWVMFLAGAFFFGTTLFGLAAADFVGPAVIKAADKGGNLALPLLAQYLGGGPGSLGGDLMLGFVSAVAVATILAVVSGLTLSTSGAIAHDFYTNWICRGAVEERKQVLIARASSVAIGVLAIVLGIGAQGVNVAVLVILAICIAASANFPVLVLSLFWRRFNTGGVIGGMLAGLVSSVVLAMIGPAWRGADALWPLVNPTVVSLPLGFLGAYIGTLLAGRDPANEARFEAVSLRVHTGMAD